MGTLLIPAKVYFDDFSFDLLEYQVHRNSQNIGTYSGLINKDELGNHIAFLLECDIKPNDILSCNNKTYIVSDIDYDYYDGNPEILKAYF